MFFLYASAVCFPPYPMGDGMSFAHSPKSIFDVSHILIIAKVEGGISG